jgi:2-oxoacid:acceptor oxidoreductase delta subunit (pyruvate/2-ketoisovalerate family)
MEELRRWQDLPVGGTVVRADVEPQKTGGWRTGERPEVDLSRCVDCLLCWLYCPDAAISADAGAFGRIDYDACKGCEICAAVCPVGAIAMVPDA